MRGRSLSRDPHRTLSRGPSRGPVPIDRSYLTMPRPPGAHDALSHPLQPMGSVGAPLRHTFSSYTSGDFSYFPAGGPTGRPTGGLVYSIFSKFPLWCESLFWWLLPILIFLVLFLLYSAGSLLLPKAKRQDYGIVIDAGSHGSRVNIFKWDSRVYDPHNPLTGPVSLPQLVGFRVYSPGIGDSFENPKEGKEQLQQMVRDAAATLAAAGVQTVRWADIPIYLKATAGMRTVAQEKRDNIMKHVRDTLHDKALNPFRFKNDFARVISGEEEGVYGWVAVNTERKTLGAPPEETLGALDMGGSSAQITFSPFFTSILEDFNSIHLGNTNLRLYSHSFLGYGWADALSRINIRLAAEALINNRQTLNRKPSPSSRLASPFMTKMRERGLQGPLRMVAEHPCFPVGSAFKFSLPEINQEGLRLYVDLAGDTLHSLLQIMNVSKNIRDKIVAASAPIGVQARHELQDEEGREARGEGALGEASEGPKGAPGTSAWVQREGPPRKRGLQGGQGKVPVDERTSPLGNAPPNLKVKINFKGSGDFDRCHALARA